MTHFIQQIYRKEKSYNGLIFLDRDGTINTAVKYLTNKEKITILPQVADAIKLLNKNGIAVIVVTNQPVVARGLVTINELKTINDVLVKKLSEKGAIIDALYSCPHHPERNHDDIPIFAMKYRIECDCRKPQVAMLAKASELYGTKNILGIIGDHERDILAGKIFGIATVLVKKNTNKKDQQQNKIPDFICDNLLDAVRTLL